VCNGFSDRLLSRLAIVTWASLNAGSVSLHLQGEQHCSSIHFDNSRYPKLELLPTHAVKNHIQSRAAHPGLIATTLSRIVITQFFMVL